MSAFDGEMSPEVESFSNMLETAVKLCVLTATIVRGRWDDTCWEDVADVFPSYRTDPPEVHYELRLKGVDVLRNLVEIGVLEGNLKDEKRARKMLGNRFHEYMVHWSRFKLNPPKFV